jgi:hypothetical protein
VLGPVWTLSIGRPLFLVLAAGPYVVLEDSFGARASMIRADPIELLK